MARRMNADSTEQAIHDFSQILEEAGRTGLRRAELSEAGYHRGLGWLSANQVRRILNKIPGIKWYPETGWIYSYCRWYLSAEQV